MRRNTHHADCQVQGPCVVDCTYLAPLEAFRVSFGSQYAREPHPRWDGAHPDGWVTILATDYEAARFHAFQMLGSAWSCLYRETDLTDAEWARLFPLGELTRVEPDGTLPASETAVFHGFTNRIV